jgi:two-component system, LytTR family, response regulator LytT
MNIVIIEDESRTADHLIRLIKQYDNSWVVLEVIDSVGRGIEWFRGRKVMPDVLLADIQLADGTSFELFDKLDPEMPVIFVTAYNEYALKAFRLNSIDYLLKPVSFTDLKNAFDKLKKRREAYIKSDMRELLRMINPGNKSWKKSFLVKSGKGYRHITVDEISYFISEEGLVFAVLLTGGRIILEESVSELSRILDPEQFFQVNRNTVIKANVIARISDYFNRRLIVQIPPGKTEVIVSRDRVRGFKEWLNK